MPRVNSTVAAIETETLRRIGWRVLPILMALFLFAIIDRSNIGFAKLQMASALHLSEAAFALGSSLFFFTYVAVEIPSALAVNRFGARLWFARIVLTWGLLTVAMAWASSGTAFYWLRLLLGAAEGGLYPGILFFITLWYPQAYRAQAFGVITLGSAIGNALSALISGPLLDMDGMLGFAGCQWVFIATGIPAVLMTAVVLIWLPNNPRDASFLSPEQKAWLAGALARTAPRQATHGSPLRAIWDLRVLVLSLIYTLLNVSLFGVIYWLPTVVKAFGVTGTQNGLLSAFPWMLSGVALLWLPRRLRTERAVLRAIATVCAVGLACFLASTLLPQDWMRYAAVALGIPCISILYPCFWTIPARLFAEARAAAAIAAVTTIGGLGGFYAQNLMPWVAHLSGRPVTAMAVPFVCLAIIGAAAVLRVRTLRRSEAVIPLLETPV